MQLTFYSSWPTTEGTRPTTLFHFVGETMHVTCARVSSGMVSEGHRALTGHTSHPLAPSWLTIRSLHSKLVARVVRGWWRLSSSFTSLLVKGSKGTILSGVTMPRRNALSQIGCLLAVWSFGDEVPRNNRRWWATLWGSVVQQVSW